MRALATAVDTVLEALVVPSFTRIGCDVRSRLERWSPVDSYDLSGRVILLSGATSGIGRAAAQTFAHSGATLVALGRDRARLEDLRRELAPVAGSRGGGVDVVVVDMGDLSAVSAAAAAVLANHSTLQVLVHNAGALSGTRRTQGGVEATVASQVLGPFLLTGLLLERLQDSAPARVITVASGGMYSAPLSVEQLEMGPGEYRGAEQYARAKRAQVTLNEMWADRVPHSGVAFHAMHPGWADTPGVRSSLPTFRRVLKPLLRTAAQAADTMVWLAADDGVPLSSSGRFWHDRRVRPVHRLARTRRADVPEARRALWEWCVERSGLGVEL